mmetsp:Transcript_28704/g.63273  ORF Transcript_28704/g.63273 Transcript_28704/m.63273 type:complete len:257 (-) Transcript_28704:233-1003(-)|eukprot:CAMPEP_0204275960 /NCGR_PEP_ID=MMETSP0468-20130131/27023_1 /ASSEMBLY_ACC=CAM_ASM_000383 /TAXON_ID=2969 /ORGANISM="Oxyrrhis marina" /LENGTH=256 /DNA_ID=CAMNT_0051252433 /DNA_START=28 /DNA_END=798 /DNA_ORIENTATION=+
MAVSQECINVIVQASQTENLGMELDRAGKGAEAAEKYGQAASELRKASLMVPPSHQDFAALTAHEEQLELRAEYCRNNPAGIPAIPLEEMIQGIQLSMPAPDAAAPQGGSDMRTVGGAAAVGGIAGLILMGPITGVALAGGAAYAATRRDSFGNAARGAGNAAAVGFDKAKEVNTKYGVTDKISSGVQSGVAKAKELDQKHKVSEQVQKGVNTAAQKATAFNQEHKVTEKASAALMAGASKVGSFFNKSSQPQSRG